MNVDRMQHIAGCRGISPSAAAIDCIAAKVHKNWEVVGDDDYRESGKPVTAVAYARAHPWKLPPC